MFGGHGIYQDGYIFGIVAWDKLYLKTGDNQEHAKRLEELGGEQFVYEKGNHKKTAMNYWTVSFDTLEDRELCRELVSKSVDISRASKKK